MGHYKKVSRSTPAEDTTHSNSKACQVMSTDADKLYEINDQSNTNRKQCYITADCEGDKLKLKIDTGATCNVMPKHIYNSLNLSNSKIVKHSQVLTSVSGHPLTVLGKALLMLEHKQAFSIHDFLVVDQGETTLLGLPSYIVMSLIETANAVANNLNVSEFTDLFEELGKYPACMP